MVILVWAMTKEKIIGFNNKLPWKIKEEMQYFQSITLNKNVLMGSKTFESIGKPLKNRYNIVVTNHQERYQHFLNDNNITFTNDIILYLKQYQGNKKTDIFIIGGAEIYKQAWDYADYLYVSVIKNLYNGDLLFPISNFSDFKLIKTTEFTEFVANIYQRKARKK